jgi:hypothetical protein
MRLYRLIISTSQRYQEVEPFCQKVVNELFGIRGKFSFGLHERNLVALGNGQAEGYSKGKVNSYKESHK